MTSKRNSDPARPARERDCALGPMVVEEEVSRVCYRQIFGVAYLLVMGVCGAVLVALGSTLYALAINCGTTATKAGSVFVAQGLGAVLSSMFCPKLYGAVRKNTVIFLSLVLVTSVLFCMPYITSVGTLHIAYFALGLLIATTITGNQTMTVLIHGAQAGPWLGANSAGFVIAGLGVTLISYFADSLLDLYVILTVASGTVGVLVIVAPAPESLPGLLQEKPAPENVQPCVPCTGSRTCMGRCSSFFSKYWIECHISGMICWIIGSQVAATAYLQTYVRVTGVISSSLAELITVDLFIALVVGSLIGLLDQQFFTLPTLYRHLTVLVLAGAVAAGAILVFQQSAFVLWVGVAAFGASNAPQWAYCVDLYNRITNQSDTGMSLLTFGMNVGASIVPYVVSWVWDYTGLPQVLIVVLLLAHIFPYPLMLNAKRLAEVRKRQESERRLSSGISSEFTGEDAPLLGPKPVSSLHDLPSLRT